MRGRKFYQAGQLHEPLAPLRMYFFLNPTVPCVPLALQFLLSLLLPPAKPCHVLSGVPSTRNKLPSPLSCCTDALSISSFSRYLNLAQDITSSAAVSSGGCLFPHHSTVLHTHTHTLTLTPCIRWPEGGAGTPLTPH